MTLSQKAVTYPKETQELTAGTHIEQLNKGQETEIAWETKNQLLTLSQADSGETLILWQLLLYCQSTVIKYVKYSISHIIFA